MKRLVSFMVVIAIASSCAVASAKGSHASGTKSSGTGSKASSTYVHGHTTKKGQYVAPHHRSTPDKTEKNNYSANGNTNPYTGKKGNKAPKR